MGGLVQICKIHSWKSTTWALVTCMAWLSVFRGHIREQTTKQFGHESFCLFNGFQKKVKPKKQVVGIKSKSNYAHLRLTKPLKIGHSKKNIFHLPTIDFQGLCLFQGGWILKLNRCIVPEEVLDRWNTNQTSSWKSKHKKRERICSIPEYHPSSIFNIFFVWSNAPVKSI